MKAKSNKIPSRRALLQMGVRSVAGAGVLETLERAAHAHSQAENRALVCIYLFGGEGGSYLPDVAGLRTLHSKNLLRVVNPGAPASRTGAPMKEPGEFMQRQYEALRFLPNGFVTLEWAAQKAALDSLTGTGAFTFRSGMSMVSFDGREREGDQFENLALRSAMSAAAPVRTPFPVTNVGRQLKDVIRLLQAGAGLGLRNPVFVCTASGFTTSAHRARLLGSRYRQLGQAIAAFYNATVELGLERQVTTYTDAEFPIEHSERAGSRLVIGGAVSDSDTGAFVAEDYASALIRWHGGELGGVRQA